MNNATDIAIDAFLDRRLYKRRDVHTKLGNRNCFFLYIYGATMACLDNDNRLFVRFQYTRRQALTYRVIVKHLLNQLPGVNIRMPLDHLLLLNNKHWGGHWVPIMEWSLDVPINLDSYRHVEFNHINP